jgi:hypothetical protein
MTRNGGVGVESRARGSYWKTLGVFFVSVSTSGGEEWNGCGE